MPAITTRLAEEMNVRPAQVQATTDLLDGGATVPFIARYRKEATGGLDDSQLRYLEERLGALRELEARRQTVLKAIEEQGQLTETLAAAIRGAETRTRLEELYQPYRRKRRTKAGIAREAGLEPLADQLLNDPQQDPETAAQAWLNPEAGIETAEAALDGARQILMERFAEQPDLVAELRTYGWEHGLLVSRVVDGAGDGSAAQRFRDYFAHAEPLKRIPSHRALAMIRGQTEEVLRLEVMWTREEADAAIAGSEDGERRSTRSSVPAGASVGEAAIARHFGLRDEGRPADAWLARTARLAWRARLAPHLDLTLKRTLREAAEAEAIRVFGVNLHDLLLAAPAGPRPTLGLDPGLRTGVKAAVIDATGGVAETATLHPFAPRNQSQAAIDRMEALVRQHGVELIAIGNGTASRETDALVGELLKRPAMTGVQKVMVSEAGASVYSASEHASRELPDLDVSLRGAVSIARRLQDPLAELVKIEPKSIGVGQYQHDVSQSHLARRLDAVVEDGVNAVGVDANTASAPLLARVSGLGPSLAEQLVAHRQDRGPFRRRSDFRHVPRLGPRAFEQAAGFLRIQGGDHPLDASAVHPEAYPVVERIVERTGRSLTSLIGDDAFLQSLSPDDYTCERFGRPTVEDILQELAKPGRDPRPTFQTARYRADVETLQDLEPDMVLEGTITNVTNFGAFVDIGVHQDGLVHISALADHFVRDPREVVRAGDVVRVRVVDVDVPRKRIALSMRSPQAADAEAGAARGATETSAAGGGGRGSDASKTRRNRGGRGKKGRKTPDAPTSEPEAQGAMADALRAARQRDG